MGKTKTSELYKAIQKTNSVVVLSKNNQTLFEHVVHPKAPLYLNAKLTENLVRVYMNMCKDLQSNKGQVGSLKQSETIKRVVYNVHGKPLIGYRCIDKCNNSYIACGKFEQECVKVYNKYANVLKELGL